MNDDLVRRTVRTVAWLLGAQLASMALVLAVFFLLSRGASASPEPKPAAGAVVSPVL